MMFFSIVRSNLFIHNCFELSVQSLNKDDLLLSINNVIKIMYKIRDVYKQIIFLIIIYLVFVSLWISQEN